MTKQAFQTREKKTRGHKLVFLYVYAAVFFFNESIAYFSELLPVTGEYTYQFRSRTIEPTVTLQVRYYVRKNLEISLNMTVSAGRNS
jgi:uncharacterized membrane-anchored protein